jgi:hypothetical protein
MDFFRRKILYFTIEGVSFLMVEKILLMNQEGSEKIPGIDSLLENNPKAF